MISADNTEIRRALGQSKVNKKLKAPHRRTASSLLHHLDQPVNLLLLDFLKDLMRPLDTLTLSLQSVETSIVHCLENLDIITTEFVSIKTVYTEDHIRGILKIPAPSDDTPTTPDPPAKRKRNIPTKFNDSIIDQKLPQFRSSDTVKELRSMVTDIVDSLDGELLGRFSDANVGIWKSFQALSPHFGTDGFLDAVKLGPLLEYAFSIPALKQGLGGDMDSAKEDLKFQARVFKKSLLKVHDNLADDRRAESITSMLRCCQANPAMSHLEIIFKVALVAGYSNATAECVFSARKRVQTQWRCRLTPYKQGNLTLLHFEKGYVRDVTFAEFLDYFARVKNRRLKLR